MLCVCVCIIRLPLTTNFDVVGFPSLCSNVIVLKSILVLLVPRSKMYTIIMIKHSHCDLLTG